MVLSCAGGGQRLAVGTERDAVNAVFVALERLDLLVYVPQPHCFVAAAGGDQLVIRRKRGAIHRPIVAFEHVSGLPLVTSHKMAVLSALADSRVCPSRQNASE